MNFLVQLQVVIIELNPFFISGYFEIKKFKNIYENNKCIQYQKQHKAFRAYVHIIIKRIEEYIYIHSFQLSNALNTSSKDISRTCKSKISYGNLVIKKKEKRTRSQGPKMKFLKMKKSIPKQCTKFQSIRIKFGLSRLLQSSGYEKSVLYSKYFKILLKNYLRLTLTIK